MFITISALTDIRFVFTLVVCRRAHVLSMVFVVQRIMTNMSHLEWKVGGPCCSSLSLFSVLCSVVFCFCFCFCFVLFVFVLYLVCLMLPMSLDFPFLIAPSVLSNVYLQCHVNPMVKTHQFYWWRKPDYPEKTKYFPQVFIT